MIVHGIGGLKVDWVATAEALAATWTVLAVDMIGFGTSSTCAAEITIRTQADAVRALMDAEGLGAADMVGNSVGGWVVASIAAETPERVGKLVLVDSAGFAAMFEEQSPVSFYPVTQEEAVDLLEHVRADPEARTPAAADAVLARLAQTGEARAGERVFAGLYASPRLEEVLPQVTAPTLVIWGAEDGLFPVALAPYVTGLIPGATVTVIPGASHFPQLDQPEAFNEALRGFLDG